MSNTGEQVRQQKKTEAGNTCGCLLFLKVGTREQLQGCPTEGGLIAEDASMLREGEESRSNNSGSSRRQGNRKCTQGIPVTGLVRREAGDRGPLTISVDHRLSCSTVRVLLARSVWDRRVLPKREIGNKESLWVTTPGGGGSYATNLRIRTVSRHFSSRATGRQCGWEEVEEEEKEEPTSGHEPCTCLGVAIKLVTRKNTFSP